MSPTACRLARAVGPAAVWGGGCTCREEAGPSEETAESEVADEQGQYSRVDLVADPRRHFCVLPGAWSTGVLDRSASTFVVVEPEREVGAKRQRADIV